MPTTKTMSIKLAPRHHTPSTELFVKHYTEHGVLGQRDCVLLIPGGPGNDHKLYDDGNQSIAHMLAKFVDVVLFDPRGCGDSESSRIEFCLLDNYIDDIEAIRQALDLNPHQFIAFGQSYGAIAALGYATQYSHCLKKLILIGGAANGQFVKQARQALAERGTAEQITMSEKIWQGSFSGSAQEMNEFYRVMGPLYAYQQQEQNGNEGEPIQINYNFDLLNRGWSDFLATFDFTMQLKNIRCPTLILQGRQDWIFSVPGVETLHAAIASSQLKIYEQCSHMLWTDQWDKFVNDVRDFICLPSKEDSG